MRMQDSNKHKQNQDATAVKTSDTPTQPNDTAGTATPATPNAATKPTDTDTSSTDTNKDKEIQSAPADASSDVPSSTAEQSTSKTSDATAAKTTDETKTTGTELTTTETTSSPTQPTTPDSQNQTPTSAAVIDDGVEAGSNRPLIAFIAGILVAVLGWYAFTNLTAPAGDETARDYADPIATVNGEPVDQDLFYQNLDETTATLEAQGIDTTDPTVQDEYEAQVVDTLVNTRLLVSAAADAGYAPSDEEIQTRITELEAQFGDAANLDSQLDELGLDRDSLYNDVREQLSVDALLAEEVLGENLTVTDEELQDAYNVLSEAGRELPELDSIRDALTAQIEQQKQQQLIQEYLDTLRAEADIEVNL